MSIIALFLVEHVQILIKSFALFTKGKSRGVVEKTGQVKTKVNKNRNMGKTEAKSKPKTVKQATVSRGQGISPKN